MFCKNCGSQLAESSKFCSNCGFKLEDDIPPASTEDTSEINDTTENVVDKEVSIPVSRFKVMKVMYQRYSQKLYISGLVAAIVGVILFLGIVLVSRIGWGKVYLYNGYDYVAVLTTISLIFMLFGFVVLSAVSIVGLIMKSRSISTSTPRPVVLRTIALLVLCFGLSIWGIGNCVNEQNKANSSGGSSYSGSYTNNYTLDKRLGLSLKVDNVKKSGNYTYVYCTVTNVSKTTKYRYVKVKALFKNYSGSIIDTDWTYAIDSVWLDPGESKTFYYMVKNTNIASATLSIVD